MNAIIISGGILEDSLLLDICNDIDSTSRVVIAVDRGLEACIRLAIKPDFIIGDFDSADVKALNYANNSGIPFIKLNPIKDDTDTEAALQLAYDNSDGDIILLGATGGRLDHLTGNLCLLLQALNKGRQLIIIDGQNRIRMTDNRVVISKNSQYGKYVSVVPWAGAAHGVTLQGFKYPVENVTLSCDTSLGISNEVVAEEAIISVTEGYVLIFETRD